MIIPEPCCVRLLRRNELFPFADVLRALAFAKRSRCGAEVIRVCDGKLLATIKPWAGSSRRLFQLNPLHDEGLLS